MIRYHNGSFKTDPCPYLDKYSLDFLKKKTKAFDNFNMDKKGLIKNNIYQVLMRYG